MLVLFDLLVLAFHSVAASFAETVYTNGNDNLFSVVHVGTDSFIGGGNYVLRLNRTNGNMSLIPFPVDAGDVSTCYGFVSEREACKNQILSIAFINSTFLLVCGTNIFAPVCYHLNTQTHEIIKSNVKHNRYLSTVAKSKHPILVLDGNTDYPQVYIAACKLNGLCTVVKRTPDLFIQTETTNTKPGGLQRPTYNKFYVSGSNGKRTLYLFYRDRSKAFENDHFAAGSVYKQYGMVSRFCEFDVGGRSAMRFNLVTVMTIRLLCPHPGRGASGVSNTYFDFMESTFRVENIVYVVFTLPSEWGFKSSALCAYNLDDVDSVMNGSTFPGGEPIYYSADGVDYGIKFTISEKVFYPGQCPPSGVSTHSITVEQETLIKRTMLLRKNLHPINDHPLYVDKYTLYQFVAAQKVGSYHIVYLLTGTGSLLKLLVDVDNNFQVKSLSQEKISVKDKVNLFSVTEQGLMVITPTQVITRSGSGCPIFDSCEACEGDPHCDWLERDGAYKCELDLSKSAVINSCPAAPGPPGSMQISGTHPDIAVMWNVSTGGAAPSSYLVSVTRKIDGAEVFAKDVNKLFPLVRPRIPAGANYVISIRAENYGTFSEASTAELRVELKKPATSVDRISDTSGRLQWGGVTDATSYNISLYRKDDTKVLRSYTIGHDPSELLQVFTLADLTNDTAYTAAVFALSRYGVHSDVSSSHFRTKETIVEEAGATERATTMSTKPTTTRSTKPTTTVSEFSELATKPKTEGSTVRMTEGNDVIIHDVTVTKEGSGTDANSGTDAESGSDAESTTVTSTSVKASDAESDRATGSPSVPIIIGMVVVAIAFLFTLLILLQNRYVMGLEINKEIPTDHVNVTLQRKYFLFLSRHNRNEVMKNLARPSVHHHPLTDSSRDVTGHALPDLHQ